MSRCHASLAGRVRELLTQILNQMESIATWQIRLVPAVSFSPFQIHAFSRRAKC